MRARKAKTEIRQEQIARTAMKLLATRGWQRVSLAAIARQVGVVTSAVYRHYRGKDQVLDAVLALVQESFQANIEAAQQSGIDPTIRLQQALMRHVDLILSGTPVPRIVLSEDVFSANARHRKRVHQIYQEYLAGIAALFREAQSQRLVRANLDCDSLAMMWLGLVQSPAILWLLGGGHFDLKEQCRRAWNVLLAGIQTQALAS